MQYFIARQPIFDRRLDVQAYELLFRDGLDNLFQVNLKDEDEASCHVISSALEILGIERVTGTRRAFINLTRNLLIQDAALVLPREWAVIELIENIPPDPEVFAACERLRQAGYQLALDDYIGGPNPLLDYADIVKLDFRATTPATRRTACRELAARGVRVLAEKVETREEFEESLALGCSLFQGFFFSRPVILSGRATPASRPHQLMLLRLVHEPVLNLDAIERVLQHEVSLSYRLLRYINSAALGIPNRIGSLRQAVLLLGEETFRRWASVAALNAMAGDKPLELVVGSTVRARFSESIARRSGTRIDAGAAFLTGLFSMIDALFDRPMRDAVEALPLFPEVRAALTGKDGVLRKVLDLVIAYERGDWGALSRSCGTLGVGEAEAPVCYYDSLAWANVTFG